MVHILYYQYLSYMQSQRKGELDESRGSHVIVCLGTISKQRVEKDCGVRTPEAVKHMSNICQIGAWAFVKVLTTFDMREAMTSCFEMSSHQDCYDTGDLRRRPLSVLSKLSSRMSKEALRTASQVDQTMPIK